MKPQFVVHTVLHKGSGAKQERTIPADGYEDARKTAATLRSKNREAEVCIAVLLKSRTILLPFMSLPDIQDAINEVLEEQTAPIPSAAVGAPAIKKSVY